MPEIHFQTYPRSRHQSKQLFHVVSVRCLNHSAVDIIHSDDGDRHCIVVLLNSSRDQKRTYIRQIGHVANTSPRRQYSGNMVSILYMCFVMSKTFIKEKVQRVWTPHHSVSSLRQNFISRFKLLDVW